MSFDKPSELEEEYFARIEFDRRKKDAEERARRMAEEERLRLRELHHMRCPRCGMELAEIAFRRVRIDRCTSCGGVWLDQGELEVVAADEGGSLLGRLSSMFRGDKPE